MTKMFKVAVVVLCVAYVVIALGYQDTVRAEGRFLANGLLPQVPIPADNPQTDAKIRLGRHLYFDKRLSSDGTINCASCHQPEKGWADTGPVSEGVAHKKGGRNSPTIIDAAYSVPQFWDGRALHLEKQAVGPLQNPVEMDLTMDVILLRLKNIPGYVKQFQEVFGAEPTEDGLAKAIASFERTIVSKDSPYDRYVQGDRAAMSKAAIRGMRLFNGKGHCSTCHSGAYFSDTEFHNLGVGYRNGKYADDGRHSVTKDPRDMGAFKTPTIRQVAVTGPYMHDGSEKTLLDVINLYNRGGTPNPNLDRAVVPLNLTNREKRDLVAFMTALTGSYPIVEAPAPLDPEITAQKLNEMLQGGVR
jgi:cytochrome c peroxidase